MRPPQRRIRCQVAASVCRGVSKLERSTRGISVRGADVAAESIDYAYVHDATVDTETGVCRKRRAFDAAGRCLPHVVHSEGDRAARPSRNKGERGPPTEHASLVPSVYADSQGLTGLGTDVGGAT